MTSVASELRKVCIAALKADANIAAEVGTAIYDVPPKDAPLPFISFGDIQVLEDDVECIRGYEVSMQIDCWVRDPNERRGAEQLNAYVVAALHEADLELESPLALMQLRISSDLVIRDNDGQTWHGITTAFAHVEEVA